MTENSERFSHIKKAVQAAKDLGITDPAKRREAVINARTAQAYPVKNPILKISPEEAIYFPSVAKPDIRNESDRVIDTAINKYLIVIEKKKDMPFVPTLVDAVHDAKPLNKKEGDPGFGEFDEFTGEIAKKVANEVGASLIVAKKSRLIADLNRAWWIRQERGGVLPKEYSRSARASFYWAVRRILQHSGRLDENEQLKEKYLRVAVHGMKDHDDFDFAIAGSERPADPEFLDRFFEAFKASLIEVGLEPKAVIAVDSDPKTAEYSGPSSIRYFREQPKNDFAKQHPAFGQNFQTIQLEIGRKMRENPTNRAKVCQAITSTIKRINEPQNN